MPESDWQRRIANVIDSLEKESPRGIACVSDALIDECLKDLFRHRMPAQKEAEELIADSGPLGSHGARLKLAYALGWIGPATFSVAKDAHKVRNRMAHEIDVNDFSHPMVRDLVDQMHAKALPGGRRIGPERDAIFWNCVTHVLRHFWDAIEYSEKGKQFPDEIEVVIEEDE